MKKSRVIRLCMGVTVMIAALMLLGDGTQIRLPLALVGKGLRAMSLSGNVGNIAAIVLYIGVSLLPLALLIKRKRQPEDLLLPVTSAVTFYALYCIINPGHRPSVLVGTVGDMVCELTVYSILAAWVILRIVRYCRSAEQSKLYSVLGWLLFGFACLCIIAGIGGFETCSGTMESVRQGNTAPGLNLIPTYTFTILRFIAEALEYGLTAWILLLAGELVAELGQDPYSDTCCRMADLTERWSRITLAVVVLMMAGLNVGQLLFAESLHHLSAEIHVPLVGVTVTLVLMAVTGLLRRGNRLKQDNDLFI